MACFTHISSPAQIAVYRRRFDWTRCARQQRVGDDQYFIYLYEQHCTPARRPDFFQLHHYIRCLSTGSIWVLSTTDDTSIRARAPLDIERHIDALWRSLTMQEAHHLEQFLDKLYYEQYARSVDRPDPLPDPKPTITTRLDAIEL